MAWVETQLLEVFRTVAGCGSITAAAQMLRFTQSAVSRQIATLEAELGTRVFDRLPRGVALTEEGHALLPHADAVLDRFATARRELDQLADDANRPAARRRVPDCGRRARAAGAHRVPGGPPRRRVVPGGGAHPEAARAARQRATPTSPWSAPRPTTRSTGYDLHHLLDERLLVAVASTHRLARRRTIRIAELAEDAFVVGSATAEDTLMRASVVTGFRPRIDIVAAEWTGKLGCVAAGLGVTLLPALAARSVPADIALLRLHPADESVRRIFAATPAARTKPAAVTAFFGYLDRAARPFR